MKRFRVSLFLCVSIPVSSLAATKPILLVTPAGVFRSEVVNGVPGPWVPQDIDVIVQGFPTGPDDPAPPDPPVADETVKKIATLSKEVLQTKENGQAAAALVDTLGKNGLTGAKFTDALHLTAPIMDSQLAAKGKISSWARQVTVISSEPQKISSGLRQAFSLPAAEMEAIARAVDSPEKQLAEEALDFAMIIRIIQMILELLKNLGII